MCDIQLLPPAVPLHDLETRKVLKKLSVTRAALAELKGISSTIPNQQILIDTLSLQEAKDSSAIENIVTTHDEIYRSNYEQNSFSSAAAKEVHTYASALKKAYQSVKRNGFISLKLILKIQQNIEGNDAGIRKQAGTVLLNDRTGEVVYTPPQEYDEIMRLLNNLEEFINEESENEMDPLTRMAIIHHQFESIHPFYDGNGRTGRILNILYLIKEDLLDIPILYISQYIIKHRSMYYQLLQTTRQEYKWEDWIVFMLDAVESTAKNTVSIIKEMKSLMLEYKQQIRGDYPKLYSQDLINNLFRHPYTKIAWLQKDLKVSRATATKYLDILSREKLLEKIKIGRSNYYINTALLKLLAKGE